MTSAIPLLVALAAGQYPWVGVGYPGGGGAPSPVVGVVDFTSGFGAVEWAGAPAPTIACEAAASGGNLTCSGATATKVGSPTTVGSPFWPTGWSGPQQKAISYGGSSDYHDLGDVGDLTGDGTVCVAYELNSLTGVQGILGKASSPTYSWYFGLNTGNVFVRSCRSVPGVACTNSGTIVATLGSSVACFSTKSGDGDTGTRRLNVNGTAASTITNAVSPIADGAGPLQIGALGDGTSKLNGKVSRVTIWNNWAASDAELALLVKSQIGLIASKPAMVVTPATPPSLLSSPVGTVSHVKFSTVAGIVDDNDIEWLTTATAPDISTGSPPHSAVASGFAADKYYQSSSSTSDVFDFSGDFYICAVVRPASGSAPVVFSNGGAGGGYYLQEYAGSAYFAAAGVTVSAAIAINSTSLVCAGKASGNILISVNGAAPTSAAAGPITLQENYWAVIGRFSLVESDYAWTGNVYEMLFVEATPSASVFSARYAEFNGASRSVSATLLTHARADATLCGPYPDGGYYWLAPNVPCIKPASGSESAGVEVYGATGNALLSSEDFTQSWSVSGVTVSANQCGFVDGAQSMDSLTTANSGNSAYQTRTVSSSAGPFTASAWFRATTGEQVGTVAVQITNFTSCTCGRSDGGACTATAAGANCIAHGTFTSDAPVRMWATGTNASAVTTVLPVIAPGRWLTSPGTICAGGVQLTQSATPLPYRKTSGTAYSAANATTLSVPTAITDPGKWAISVTANRHSWGPTSITESGFCSSYKPIFTIFQSPRTAGHLITAMASDGVMYFDTFDSASAAAKRSAIPNATLLALGAGSRTIQAGLAGTIPSLSIDSTIIGSVSGGGTGVITSFQAQSIDIGNMGGATYVGSCPFNGTFSRVVQCRRASGCR